MSLHKKGTLKEFAATAICGNDITSSCLYVSALSIVYAGKWAWLSLLLVSGVLFVYRSIYAEVVGALPLNGGAYNALLNTTSKSTASMAACLTLLSYMATMLHRIAILRAFLYVFRAISEKVALLTENVSRDIQDQITTINAQQIVFFTRAGKLANLNLAINYVAQNEHTNRMKIVTVVEDPVSISPQMEEEIKFLDRAYPDIDIEFVVYQGKFGPEIIQELSQKWSIPPNFMFIGSPQNDFEFSLAELGGVRLII